MKGYNLYSVTRVRKHTNCAGCGKEIGQNNYTKYCQATANACRQRAVRNTERGKEYVKMYNKRYKKAEIEKICQICGDKYMTARKNKSTCDKYECKRKRPELHRAKMYAKNLGIYDAYKYLDSVRKKIKRGTAMPPTRCGKCNNTVESEYEFHHADYTKPHELIALCKPCHKEIHSITACNNTL